METNSAKWSLNGLDWQKWDKNVKLFLIPVAIIYLTFLAGAVQQNGLQWSDFAPNQVVLGSMITYVINALLDLFKKYSQEKPAVY